MGDSPSIYTTVCMVSFNSNAWSDIVKVDSLTLDIKQVHSSTDHVGVSVR